jgi:cytochrome c peroxidase
MGRASWCFTLGVLAAAALHVQACATAQPQAAQPQAAQPQAEHPQAEQPQAGQPQGAPPQGPTPERTTRPSSEREQGAQEQAAQEQAAMVPEQLPLGFTTALWRLSVLRGREPTPERVQLGEKLFSDVRLSADDTVSCATCHDPNKGFTDRLPRSKGIKGQQVQRNSPTILNALFNATQFWDGRAATLEDQAKLPITNPVEMGVKDGEALERKLRGVPEYVEAFRRVYGRELTFEDVADAIAAFEREQMAGDSPFDRFILGDAKAMNAAEKRGWALFNGKGRCNTCHQANRVMPLFSDMRFHNIGIAAHRTDFVKLAREGLRLVRMGDQDQIDRLAIESPSYTELGRFLVTRNESDVGAFRTPTLRNIALTAPYMHDGSLATLWDVMDHYNKGGVPNPFLDGGMQRLGLTEPELDDLVAFMGALTSARFAADGRAQMAAQRRRKHIRPERDTAVAMGKKGNLGDLAVDPDPKVKDPATIGVYGVVPGVVPAMTQGGTQGGTP